MPSQLGRIILNRSDILKLVVRPLTIVLLNMDLPGFEPGASRMRSEHSATELQALFRVQ